MKFRMGARMSKGVLVGALILTGALGSMLKAGDSRKEIHYKDGNTYEIPLLFGKPEVYHDDEVGFLKIWPAVARPDDGKPWELCWKIRIGCLQEGLHQLEIDPGLEPGRRVIGAISGRQGRQLSYYEISTAFRSQATDLWDWLDGEDDAWLPFRIKVHRDSDPKDREFIQWVKLVDSDRKHLKNNLADLEQYDLGTPMTISDVNGVAHTIRGLKAYPIPWRSPGFSIKNLSPSAAKGPDGKPVFAWALDGYFPAKRDADITITLNDFPDIPPQKGHSSNADQFRFVCADSVHSPHVWDWLNKPGDTWLDFTIKIEGAGEAPIEGEQWVRMAESDKKRIREILKAEGF